MYIRQKELYSQPVEERENEKTLLIEYYFKTYKVCDYSKNIVNLRPQQR